MSILKPGTLCVIVAGCPENIGLIVEVVAHLGALPQSDDAYKIQTTSGRPFPQLRSGCGKRFLAGYSAKAVTDRYKLRPLVAPGDGAGLHDVEIINPENRGDEPAPAPSRPATTMTPADGEPKRDGA